MANITILFGAILILLGVVGYFGSGQASLTALIPAGFGVALAIPGAIARDERRLKHAMHAAAMVGVIGFLGSVGGWLDLPALFAGGAERPLSIVSKSAMAALMAVYVGLCVKSFIDVRRAREAAADG